MAAPDQSSPFPGFRTLLVLGRVSNLPSVWSNCLLGFVVSWQSAHNKPPGIHPLVALVPFIMGASLLYLFGMFANDWQDAEWDAQHGKRRPIPLGWIHRHNVGLFALFLLFLGLSTTWQAGIWTVALLASILLYTFIHKKTALSVFPMAACRFFLVLMASSQAAGPLAWWPALTLALYLLALTWIARNEHRLGTTGLVGHLLAAICLHDAIWLFACSNWSFGVAAIACYASSRILQKSIPAT